MSCVKKIVELSNGAISNQEAKSLLNKVDRMARKAASSGTPYEQAVTQEVKKRLEITAENIAKQKANMARNMLVKTQLNARIDRLVNSGLSPEEAFGALLEGRSRPQKETANSVDLSKRTLASVYLGDMVYSLKKNDLLTIFNSGELDDLIGRELWAISEKSPQATQSKEARQIAELIHETMDKQRVRLNDAGADIAQVAGNVMPQRHDTYAMVKAGEDGWVSFMRPLIDENRSFDGDAPDIDAALRGAYKAMVTGVRLDDPLSDTPKLFQFQSGENLAKRLSRARRIHFKSYDAWKQWNDQYGVKSVREGIVDSVAYSAGNIALLENLGTNPALMAQTVAKEALQRHRDKLKGEGAQAKIQSMVDGVTGKNLIAADPKLARAGSLIRTYQGVTKLGGALLSSLTDIPIKAAEYKFQGKTWLESYGQSFSDIANVFKTREERAEFLSLTGVYYENLVSALFTPEDDLTGKAAKLQRLFFKLNGLTAWTDGHKEAMAMAMSHHLAQKKNVKLDALDNDTKRLFDNYGITEADWDNIRTAIRTMDDGREYIFSEDIKDQTAKEKLIGYYIDRQSFGILSPTAREARLVSLNTQRGTPIGEVTRLAMQFKSFPLTMITKTWGRTFYGKGELDIPAMAHLIVSSVAFGYMAMTAKDMLRNKTPKDPAKLETWYASLAQGGGLGILGDVLLNDGSGMGRSVSEIAAGPTFGMIDSIAKIYSAGIRGEGSARQATTTAIGLIPFNNLFYTRAALDHMLLLDMQERMSPGYTRRMETNMRNVYGQEFIFK